MDTHEFPGMAANIRLFSSIISKLARQELEQRMVAAGIQLTAGQFWVLRLLRVHEHTLAELGRRLRLDPSTLVTVVDALESKGFLQRVPDPRDRRRTPIKLTPTGSALLEEIAQLDDESALVNSLRQMGAVQSQQLLSLLSQFVEHLSDDEELISFCHSLQHIPAEEL